METGHERIARMKEYTVSLLKVLKAGKIPVADAEKYVEESERLLRAEMRLCKQQWPEDKLPPVMKEIKEVAGSGSPSEDEIASVRKLLEAVRKEIASNEQ